MIIRRGETFSDEDYPGFILTLEDNYFEDGEEYFEVTGGHPDGREIEGRAFPVWRDREWQLDFYCMKEPFVSPSKSAI